MQHKNNKVERMKQNRPLIAHLCMFMACAFWGLMAPLGKDAMTHGIDGVAMVTFPRPTRQPSAPPC